MTAAHYTAGPMWPLLLSIGVSLLATLVIVRLALPLARFVGDLDLSGPQKFHAHPVPRIGGAGIVLGVASGAALAAARQPSLAGLAIGLLLAALPVFAAGLAEDLTKSQSPRRRLFFSAVSAALAVWLVNAVIERTGLPGLDWVVGFGLGAALVTVFVVTGVAHAVNIIDGFNGLASMCVILMLTGLAYVAFDVGDREIFVLALVGIGAVLGFFVWNFPLGLIFLGDGGAYFLGFYLAELAILLLHRNADVSPMFPLMLCMYPVFETLFSIYRKKWLRGMSPGLPDGVHLHMLVFKRLMRWAVGNRNARDLTRRNSMTSPYLWILCSLTVVPAVLFYASTPILLGLIVLFGVAYVLIYWRIVRFKAPRWLVYRTTRPGLEHEAGDNPAR
jgi:UDP-N-acetylmuramyl pentapeptide phosphotransferase/UDP-N-acetylglucosamine-1-phosphate transferase